MNKWQMEVGQLGPWRDGRAVDSKQRVHFSIHPNGRNKTNKKKGK